MRVHNGAPQATTIQGAVSHVRAGHLQRIPIPQPYSRLVALPSNCFRRKPCRQERPVGATENGGLNCAVRHTAGQHRMQLSGQVGHNARMLQTVAERVHAEQAIQGSS